jgi:two-component system, OmpR family, sensor histidine kinase ChvG
MALATDIGRAEAQSRGLLDGQAPGLGPPGGVRLEAAGPPAEPLHAKESPRRRISPLTWRIVVINALGLLVFVVGVLALNNFRAGLVDARIAALGTEGQIIAGALVEAALAEPETPGIGLPQINVETAAPILRRLAETSGSRLRLYDSHGRLLLDSRNLLPGSQVQSYGLPAPGGLLGSWPWLARIYDWVIGRLPSFDLPRYHEVPGADATLYPEVTAALLGEKQEAVRATDIGHVIVSVAVPVQRLKMVQGALLLSSEGPQIETMLRAERLQIVQMFVVALAVSIALSILVSGAIVRPIRLLARGAEEARRRLRGRTAIPTFGRRSDEIGELASALSNMTQGLYERLDAIESFAADVSHEIKNPLTSLRSAVETLQRTEDAARKEKLLGIIKDDVARIDRLITDIAAASRLDAELTRERMGPVDLAQLLKGLAAMANERLGGVPARVEVSVDSGALLDPAAFVISGLEDRLGQVFRNVIDNALTFSPEGGVVQIGLKLGRDGVAVSVEDDGPGIPPESLERIFERFYTSREEAPDGRDAFGKHSGLGLAITRQIVLAHQGRIHAENRIDKAGAIKGARFVIRLPR